jgi:hypothetical protein
MKPKTFSILASVFVLAALFLMTSGNGVVAQGPGLQNGNNVQSSTQFVGGSDQTPQTVLSPQGIASSAFTYQGQLKKSTGPVTDVCSMAFRLYSAASAGTLAADPITSTVPVTGGLFTVQLAWSSAFQGDDRWLDVAVKCSADSAYATLSPRQQITGAPYAFTLRPGANIVGNLPGWNAIYASNAATTDYSYGIRSESNAPRGRGLSGESYATGGMGVYGYSVSSGGAGVAGYIGSDNLDVYTFGNQQYGVYGMSQPSSGVGVYGTAPYTGVVGRASATSGEIVGVYGVVTSTNDADAIGVYGGESGGTGRYHTGHFIGSGVWGDSHDRLGVLGTSSYIGVVGNTTSSSTYGAGVYGEAPSGGYAGYFNRNVYVAGNFSVGGTKAFKIDNPLNPKNQYLYHYAVESPQVQNVYNGTVTLDAQGGAVVQLPAYFSAVNTGDYRYYLTAIGAPMPNLYVAEEILGNTFKVAGGVAGKKVSWMVYGQRNDPWVRDNPQPDVVAKPEAEVGTYVYPQGYGQPESVSVSNWLVQPQGAYTTTEPGFTPQTSTPPGPNSNSGAPTQP